MNQAILSPHGGPLVAYAATRLSAEVFSHPVWIRFGNEHLSGSPDIIVPLSSAARSLQEQDASSACQILLVCAFYQNYAGQRFQATQTMQQALALAEQAHLGKESVWAIWGACAIAFQQGKYEEATAYLVDLQAVLGIQNEWMLANFIDVIRQSFQNAAAVMRENPSEVTSDQVLKEISAFTLDWFQHWGFPPRAAEPEFDRVSQSESSQTVTYTTWIQSFFSVQRWQGRWHTLMLAIRGELRLQWIKNDRPATGQSVSVWGSMLGSLRLHRSRGNSHAQTVAEPPQNSSILALPPVQESSLANVSSRKRKSAARDSQGAGKRRSKKAPTPTPIAVHMLGPFGMTIGDSAPKLPASRGLSLLKYLLLHHKQSIPREVLMDVFWPEAEPEMARNNLNVAMHNLRKALFEVTDLPMILFENGLYRLPSDVQIWLDVEEFERCLRAGLRLEARNQLSAAVTEYETAISLYQGDFLEQDPYEEWTIVDRERLRVNYLDTLDRLSQIYFKQERYAACITVCQMILARDRCREDAHCLLMHCYSRQGQSHLALRQFQSCVEALREELDAEPEPTTLQLAERIRRHERV